MENIFNNTQVAFALKTDTELERAYFLFKMIDNEPLVRIGTAVTNFALKAHLPVESLIRATVFDHFCGGVNEEDCLSVVDKMFSKFDRFQCHFQSSVELLFFFFSFNRIIQNRRNAFGNDIENGRIC